MGYKLILYKGKLAVVRRKYAELPDRWTKEEDVSDRFTHNSEGFWETVFVEEGSELYHEYVDIHLIDERMDTRIAELASTSISYGHRFVSDTYIFPSIFEIGYKKAAEEMLTKDQVEDVIQMVRSECGGFGKHMSTDELFEYAKRPKVRIEFDEDNAPIKAVLL